MPADESIPRSQAIAALGLLAAPYLLNDFANIYVHAPVPWLACDYGSRVFSLVSIAWLLRRGMIRWPDLHLRGVAWWRLAVGTFAATLVGLLLTSDEARDAFARLTSRQFGFIPEIGPDWLHRVDYWGGIALVAVSEELVFRGAFPRIILRCGGSSGVALFVSTVMFGLAHWSLGLGSIVQTALIGLWFGITAQSSRSLWPVIIAHYVVDLVAFR